MTAKKSPTNTSAGDALPYFRKEGITFLRGLARVNRKDPAEARAWFNSKKSVFETELKQPMLAVVRKITDAMLDFAPEHVRPPEKTLFRIYRDTRFANDKRPYKDHIGAWWSRHGLEKTSGAGFYFHVGPTEVVIAAGAYMPEKEQLAAIRHWMLENHAEFRRLVHSPSIRKLFREFEGSPLTRTPKGFPSELDGNPHPADELVRCRQWGLAATLPVETALSQDFARQVAAAFKLAAPVVAALNTPILAHLKAGSRPATRILFGLPDGPKSAKTR